MRWLLVVSLLLFAACTPSESKTTPPVVGVPSSEDPEPVASATPETSERKSGEAVLLGVVRRFGTKVCRGRNGEADWKDEHLRAGFVRLEGKARELEALRGKPAILFGTVTKTGAPDIPDEEGDCPPIQRRSDWVSTPDGTALQRDPVSKVAAFRVRSAKPFTALSAEVNGEELAIQLDNPLREAFSPVIRVHYEGCYGKAMTHTEGRVLGELAPRGKAKLSVPVYVVAGARERGHSATSIQLQGEAKDVYFDLDVALPRLGVELACPKR